MNQEYEYAVELVKKANEAYQRKDYQESLEFYKQAYSIRPSESIKKWIKFLKRRIDASGKKSDKPPKNPTLLLKALGIKREQEQKTNNQSGQLNKQKKRLEMAPPQNTQRVEMAPPQKENNALTPPPLQQAQAADLSQAPTVSSKVYNDVTTGAPLTAPTTSTQTSLPQQQTTPSTSPQQNVLVQQSTRKTPSKTLESPTTTSSAALPTDSPLIREQMPEPIDYRKSLLFLTLLHLLLLLIVAFGIFFKMPTPSSSTTTPKLSWQYRSIQIQASTLKNPSLQNSIIAKMGAQGWELISIRPVNTTKTKKTTLQNLICVFKRLQKK